MWCHLCFYKLRGARLMFTLIMPSRCVMLLLMFCKQSVKLDSPIKWLLFTRADGRFQSTFSIFFVIVMLLHLKMVNNRKWHNDLSTKHFASSCLYLHVYSDHKSHDFSYEIRVHVAAAVELITSTLICCFLTLMPQSPLWLSDWLIPFVFTLVNTVMYIWDRKQI